MVSDYSFSVKGVIIFPDFFSFSPPLSNMLLTSQSTRFSAKPNYFVGFSAKIEIFFYK